MVRSVLYLQPRDDGHGALVDFYRRHDVLATAVRAAGCRATELQVPVDGSGPAVVTALWDDEAAYQGWIDHELRGSGRDELVELLELGDDGAVPSGRLYRVAVTASGEPVPAEAEERHSQRTGPEA